jgi:hypothetical protein
MFSVVKMSDFYAFSTLPEKRVISRETTMDTLVWELLADESRKLKQSCS